MRIWCKEIICAFIITMICHGGVLAQSGPGSRGENLVSQHCAMCHAVGRSGGSPNVLAPAFRTLSQRYVIESIEDALLNGVLFGHPVMPQFKFPYRDANAIMRYLQSIQEQ